MHKSAGRLLVGRPARKSKCAVPACLSKESRLPKEKFSRNNCGCGRKLIYRKLSTLRFDKTNIKPYPIHTDV